MSLNLAYVNRSMDAAFALVLRDSRAWDKFDLSADGFYRSFAAILVAIPINLGIDIISMQVAIAERVREGGRAVHHTFTFSEALFSTVVLCVEWMIFPVAMIFVLRFLGLQHRYVPLIVAHNWGTVVILLFYMLLFLLFAAGIIASQDVLALIPIYLILTLYYRFYTAETALGAGWSVAASIAILALVLQIYFWQGVQATAGLWLPMASQ